MLENNLTKSAILMLVLVVTVIGSWEIYLRQKGVSNAYDDGGPMWSDKRALVYGDRTDVFIGASRIKYDLDVDTWEQLTGRKAVQLALEGQSAVPSLADLGNDPNFRGKVIVDMTEICYFSDAPGDRSQIESDIRYYHQETPAQRVSFFIDHQLENRLIFLDQQFLSLGTMLDKLEIKNRPNVKGHSLFPLEFWRQDFSRQTRMMPVFLTDTSLQNKVTRLWGRGIDAASKAPRPKVDPVPGIIQESKDAVAKIRAHGGDVVFVRCPSSGRYWPSEQERFPRQKCWDPLLAATGCKGYFFTDYPGLAKYVPVEWSHLSPEDAAGFTKELIKVLPPSFTR